MPLGDCKVSAIAPSNLKRAEAALPHFESMPPEAVAGFHLPLLLIPVHAAAANGVSSTRVLYILVNGFPVWPGLLHRALPIAI